MSDSEIFDAWIEFHLPPGRKDDPETKRWLEITARAVEVLRAHRQPIDGVAPLGDEAWISPH